MTDGTLALVPTDERPTRAKRRCARLDGFTLHANVFVPEGNREALERLCRYMARPSFSLARLRALPDGRVAYRLKRPLANGARELVLDRDPLLERLAALVPPPRANLVRYFGVLAPGSRLRKAVVPKPAPLPVGRKRPGRMDWASLLWRVYKVDAFTCAACGGKARVLAAIRDREVVKKLLRHLKLPERAPFILPAREVAQLELPLGATRSVVELEGELELDEAVAVELLPAWMRELPRPTRARRRERARQVARAVERELVDETPEVQRLPAWMRSSGEVARAPRPERE